VEKNSFNQFLSPTLSTDKNSFNQSASSTLSIDKSSFDQCVNSTLSVDENSFSQSLILTILEATESVNYSAPIINNTDSEARISQQSEIGSRKSYEVDVDGNIVMQRTIYNNLKSLIKNTNVKIIEDNTGTGYEQFLVDMSILHDKLILNKIVDLPPGVDKINDYLGLFGSGETYPKKNDMIVLSKFLNADYIRWEKG